MVFMISGFSVGSYENVPHEGIWVVKVMKKMSSIVEICEEVWYGERGIVDDWCE
jgi:hypothetical protein